MLLGAALLLASCGGGAQPSETTETTTTPPGSPTTTTTAAESTTVPIAPATSTTMADEPGSEVDPLSVMSQECIDLFVEYAQALEPVIDGANPDFLSDEELEALTSELDPIQIEYDAAVAASDCPDTDIRTDRDLMTVMLDLTRSEAPGALSMMEWVADLGGYYDDFPDVSTGDCETDLAELQAKVRSTDTPNDLSRLDIIDMQNLVSSLHETCSDQVLEYFQSPEYRAWAGVEGS